jgi:hypothetical protein
MVLVGMIEELGHRMVAEAGNIQGALPLAQTAVPLLQKPFVRSKLGQTINSMISTTNGQFA